MFSWPPSTGSIQRPLGGPASRWTLRWVGVFARVCLPAVVSQATSSPLCSVQICWAVHWPARSNSAILLCLFVCLFVSVGKGPASGESSLERKWGLLYLSFSLSRPFTPVRVGKRANFHIPRAREPAIWAGNVRVN